MQINIVACARAICCCADARRLQGRREQQDRKACMYDAHDRLRSIHPGSRARRALSDVEQQRASPACRVLTLKHFEATIARASRRRNKFPCARRVSTAGALLH